MKENLHGFMDQPLTRYLPELEKRDTRFTKITPENLINMRSGIAFDNDVSFPFYNEDKPIVYYASDLEKVLFSHPEIESEPGPFLYNDFNPNLLALAFERASGRSIQELLQAELWSPLNAQYDALWMTDYRGYPLMESGLGATPVDLARIGQIMLDVGESSSDFIPPDWHRQSTQLNNNKPVYNDGKPAWHYQYGWWVMPRYSGLADYAAIGHLGQYIYVSPQSRMVIVRTGFGKGKWSDSDFIRLFYQAAGALRP